MINTAIIRRRLFVVRRQRVQLQSKDSLLLYFFLSVFNGRIKSEQRRGQACMCIVTAAGRILALQRAYQAFASRHLIFSPEPLSRNATGSETDRQRPVMSMGQWWRDTLTSSAASTNYGSSGDRGPQKFNSVGIHAGVPNVRYQITPTRVRCFFYFVPITDVIVKFFWHCTGSVDNSKGRWRTLMIFFDRSDV